MLNFHAKADNFPPRHRFDQAFFLVMVGLVWAAILSGFIYHNVNKFMGGTLSYPWIVHVHAFAFFLWLVFFTAQVLLVRRGSVSLHPKLGPFGAGLAAAMVVLGVLTAIITERLKFGQPDADTRFLSVMFADMLVFGGLVATGMFLRGSPAAHKRLMLIATLVLTDAGFGRWLSPAISRLFGQTDYWMIPTLSEGAWPFIRFQLLPAYSLIAIAGVYDLLTRRRLHPAYVAGVAWCLSLHLLAGWLYFEPAWNKVALRIIGN